MLEFKNLQIDESLNENTLIFSKGLLYKIGNIVVFIVFSWCAILALLLVYNPKRGTINTGLLFYVSISIFTFCLYVIYRKVTEKRLIKITSKFDTEGNKELIIKYCKGHNFEQYVIWDNLIIYDDPSPFNPNYGSSMIFLFRNNDVYFTILKQNYKANIPVLVYHLFLKKDLKKILN